MTGGDLGEQPAGGLPSPPAGSPPTESPPQPPGSTAESAGEPVSPALPRVEAAKPPPMAGGAPQPTRGASTWYRTDQDRHKSVRRRANPWYRRVLRGVVGLCLLVALGVGLYFGAREIQDYVNRDRLPAPGAEIPEYRSTSFQVQSMSPGPTVDGTVTIDVATGAFEFVGRANGPQSGLQVLSPDGAAVYVRNDTGEWRAAASGDPTVADIRTAIAYLADADTADHILVNRLRQGFVELDAQETEGADDNERTRYEMTLDTTAFRESYPLQWSSFQREAIPSAPETAAFPVVMWIDTENVLVRLGTSYWSWERLTYTTERFQPIDPSQAVLDATTDTTTDATTDGG